MQSPHDELKLSSDAYNGQLGRFGGSDSAVRPGLWSITFVVNTERAKSSLSYAIINKIVEWHKALGFSGASIHSDWRTAINHWARKISTVGGSLRGIQILAGRSALSTTQRYIESDGLAQRPVLEMV